MQPVLVQVRIEAHHVPKRRQAAVVHVRRGLCHPAQARNAKLPEVAVLCLDMARADAALSRRVVIEAPEEIEGTRLQLLNAAMPSGIHPARRGEEGNPRVGELAVRELRPEVTRAAVSFADEDAQAALSGKRISGFGFSTRKGVAELVEGGALADERLLERRERLTRVH